MPAMTSAGTDAALGHATLAVGVVFGISLLIGVILIAIAERSLRAEARSGYGAHAAPQPRADPPVAPYPPIGPYPPTGPYPTVGQHAPAGQYPGPDGQYFGLFTGAPQTEEFYGQVQPPAVSADPHPHHEPPGTERRAAPAPAD